MATKTPLKLAVYDDFPESDRLALEAKGHTVEVVSDDYDAVVGSKCMRYLPEYAGLTDALLRSLQQAKTKQAKGKK